VTVVKEQIKSNSIIYVKPKTIKLVKFVSSPLNTHSIKEKEQRLVGLESG
jgi:hypothetical protein